MSIKIDQAFVFDFRIKKFCLLPVAYENDGYEPTPGTPYVSVRSFPNAESAGDLASTNETTGLFQFTLNYPEGSGAITAKQVREDIFAAYPIGRRLTYSGQRLTITGRDPFRAYPDDGWFKVIGRISYRATTAR